jgi:hypothetical protein
VLLKKINQNTCIDRYLANPLAHGGCADLFKETIPVYSESNEAQTRYNDVVHY